MRPNNLAAARDDWDADSPYVHAVDRRYEHHLSHDGDRH